VCSTNPIAACRSDPAVTVNVNARRSIGGTRKHLLEAPGIEMAAVRGL
jgi:hypothetical protein